MCASPANVPPQAPQLNPPPQAPNSGELFAKIAGGIAALLGGVAALYRVNKWLGIIAPYLVMLAVLYIYSRTEPKDDEGARLRATAGTVFWVLFVFSLLLGFVIPMPRQ